MIIKWPVLTLYWKQWGWKEDWKGGDGEDASGKDGLILCRSARWESSLSAASPLVGSRARVGGCKFLAGCQNQRVHSPQVFAFLLRYGYNVKLMELNSGLIIGLVWAYVNILFLFEWYIIWMKFMCWLFSNCFLQRNVISSGIMSTCRMFFDWNVMLHSQNFLKSCPDIQWRRAAS